MSCPNKPISDGLQYVLPAPASLASTYSFPYSSRNSSPTDSGVSSQPITAPSYRGCKPEQCRIDNNGMVWPKTKLKLTHACRSFLLLINHLSTVRSAPSGTDSRFQHLATSNSGIFLLKVSIWHYRKQHLRFPLAKHLMSIFVLNNCRSDAGHIRRWGGPWPSETWILNFRRDGILFYCY